MTGGEYSSVRERLTQYRGRSVLAACGVGVSAFAIVALTSLVGSVFQDITKGVTALGSHVIFVMPDDGVILDRPRQPLTSRDADAVRRLVSGVDQVVAFISLTGFLRGCGERRVVQILGASPIQQAIEGWRLESGRFVHSRDVEQRHAVALLGASTKWAANCAHGTRAHVMVGGYHHEVIGVLRPRGSRWGTNLDNVVLVPLTLLEARYPTRIAAGALLVQVSLRDDPAKVAERVRHVLKERRGGRAADPEEFVVRTQSSVVSELDDVQRLGVAITVALLCVSLVVAAIGVLNAVMTAVVERTPEIGLRRAVGATRGDIKRQFAIEATLIGFCGSSAGGLVGVATATLLEWAMALPLYVHWPVVASATIVSAVLGLLAGLAPAIRAASIAPIVAVRYE